MQRKSVRAVALGAALLAMAAPALADIKDYEFQLVDKEVQQGAATIAVKLVHRPSGRAIPDAVIFARRLDMGPDNMQGMTAPLEPAPSTEPGVYRFTTDLTMAGNWALSLGAKVQGETGTVESKLIVRANAGEDVGFDAPKAAAETATAEAPRGQRKILYYRNPMGHPDTSPVPKKDSMGMDYIPVYEGDADEGATVKVSPGRIQRTGVTTEPVGKRAITRNIRAPGVVELDERRITVVAPRFDGFIDSVGPVTSGTHIRKGQPLMTVFGQELLNQAARLLVERKSGPRGDANLAGRSRGVIGARRRLLNFGVPEEYIDRIERDGIVPDTIAWSAPRGGVVLERNAVDGQGFKAGDVLFRIADHSVVWVMADVAEGDLGALKPGQHVKVTTRAHPGRVFTGKVSVVYPHLMKETRTVRVRIELPNPDLALLPDMYADVDIATGSDELVIAVPESAVIDSGMRQVVILDRDEGRFEPRDVKLGRKGDGFVEVVSGLQDGQRIVVNGNFLIDAESNLQAALKGLMAPPDKEAHQ